MALTQVEPVTQLQRNYQPIFEKLANGPVVLSRAGRAAAVLMSVEDYDRQAERLALLERQVVGDQAIEADQWIDAAEVGEKLAALGG